MRFIKRLAVLCATLCLLFAGMQSAANVAFAEDKTATDVLEDLSRDKSFNKENYPTKNRRLFFTDNPTCRKRK